MMRYIFEVLDDDGKVVLAVETIHLETLKEIVIVKDGEAEYLFKS